MLSAAGINCLPHEAELLQRLTESLIITFLINGYIVFSFTYVFLTVLLFVFPRLCFFANFTIPSCIFDGVYAIPEVRLPVKISMFDYRKYLYGLFDLRGLFGLFGRRFSSIIRV